LKFKVLAVVNINTAYFLDATPVSLVYIQQLSEQHSATIVSEKEIKAEALGSSQASVRIYLIT
jgi:hypothetical protein